MLIAVGGGLGAALCFALAALCASSSSREIGAVSTLAWVMALGLGVLVVPITLAGHPSHLSGDTVALLCIAGLSNVAGLHLEYVAFRRVAVGIVVAVASTEGMVAAVLSSVFGAPLAASTIVLLVVITIGVVLAAAHLDPPGDELAGSRSQDGPRSLPGQVMRRLDGSHTRSALLVIPVALLFGTTLYATGRGRDGGAHHLGAAAGKAFRHASHNGPTAGPPEVEDQPADVPARVECRGRGSRGPRELHLRGASRSRRRRRARIAECRHHHCRGVLPLR